MVKLFDSSTPSSSVPPPGVLAKALNVSTHDSGSLLVARLASIEESSDRYLRRNQISTSTGYQQLHVIAPRSGQQVIYQLADAGPEDVEIAGRAIPARHFTLTRGDGVKREVWVDARGRLLKVLLPDRGLIAVRDGPPR